MNWIKVEDEMPSNGKPAFRTFCNDGEIHENIWYDTQTKCWMKDSPMDYFGKYEGKVTHWMSSPEKP